MGRYPTKNLNLPPRMRKRRKGKKDYFAYDCGGKPRKEVSLGTDYILALKKYAELEINSTAKPQNAVTFKMCADRYLIEVLPLKALRTQEENIKELNFISRFYNDPPFLLEEITPQKIYEYMDWRVKIAQKYAKDNNKPMHPKRGHVQANREKALISHIWNMAIKWGYTAKPNPCSDVKGFKEPKRNRYVEDIELNSIRKHLDQPTIDFADLSYYTGQRVSDILKLKETDIKNGYLEFTQNKTGVKLRIEIKGELQTIIARIMARKSKHAIRSLNLIVNENGQALTIRSLWHRFTKARKESGVHFQLKDLRPKALTDKRENTGDIYKAKLLGGHSSVTTTEGYIRNRKGDKIEPTK